MDVRLACHGVSGILYGGPSFFLSFCFGRLSLRGYSFVKRIRFFILVLLIFYLSG